MADKSRLQLIVKTRLFYPLQALVSYAAFFLVRALPIDGASALGGWLGRVIGPRLSVTKVARRNLARAFPEKGTDEIERIIVAMWENVGRSVFEFPNLHNLRMYEDGGHVEVVGAEHIDALKDDGKPGIFFTAHLANWEVPALTVDRRGLPIHLIYRAPSNRLNDALFRFRQPGSGELIPKGSPGAKQALRLLKGGGHLGIVMDQKMNDGIAVPFFGRDAMTAPALAQFALKFDCPVVPVRAERLEGARFRITHFPPMEITRTGDRQADIAAIIARVNATIEEWVRQRPEQWLWLHNRWPD